MNRSNKQRTGIFHPGLQPGRWLGPSLLCALLSASVATAHPMGIGLGAEHSKGCPPPLMAGAVPPLPARRLPPPQIQKSPICSLLKLPKDAQKVHLQTPQFYFSKGVFYLEIHGRFQVVPPPSGATVAKLPEAITTLIIEGQRYFCLEGVFYQQLAGEQAGYIVVPSPLGHPHGGPAPMGPPPLRSEVHPHPMMEPAMVIIVVQRKTGQMQVVLKREGHRWIGPAGEIYDRLPTEAELIETAE